MTNPIVLNARVTLRGEISGVERVAHEIFARLCQRDPELYARLHPPRFAGRALGQAWEQFVLPVRAARLRAALVYSPANLAPLGWPRNVVVVHDAAVWRSPESFSGTYVRWHQLVAATAARRALRVVTVSQFSRRELIETLGLDPGRVVIVSNGVDERFNPDVDPEPMLRRRRLVQPYVLTVGTADQRKNLPLLGSLASSLARSGVKVVWAGGGRSYLPSDGSASGVRSLGYVEDADLPGLYTGALAFVLPSRYEGFGLTCLEAMASGTPVIAADRAALPETCGEAALLVDPDDEAGFVEAVIRVLEDRSLSERLRSAGLQRASGFSWRRSADATHILLSELAAQRG